MPGPEFKIKLKFYDIYRMGVKEISFYGLKGAYNYICATSVNSKHTPLKSYEQITRLVKKYGKFEFTDTLSIHFLIIESTLYK